VAETVVTSDDTLAFTVIARDSVGIDQDITPLCTFVTDDTVKGEIVGNVYYPGIADSHWVYISYQNLADSVLVRVLPGQVIWVDILADSLLMDVATSLQIPVQGLDSDSNAAAATYMWSVIDPTLGTLDSAGTFSAHRGGSTWVYVEWGFSRDSVFVTIEDKLAPVTRLATLPDTIRLSAAIQITFISRDTLAGHQGTPPDRIVYFYNLDNQGWQQSDTAVMAFYPLPDGDHQIKVAGQDEFGNVDTVAGPAVGRFNTQLSPYPLPPERWQMISIPKDVQGQRINDIVASDSSTEIYLYRWDETAEFDWIRLHNVDVAGAPLEPGAGYWMSATESVRISLDTSHLFVTKADTLDLTAGWNQVGNSFAYTVDWREAKVVAYGAMEIAMTNAIYSGVLENALFSYDWTVDTVRYTMQEPCRTLPGPCPFRPGRGTGSRRTRIAR
jgi:hypothetical protein